MKILVIGSGGREHAITWKLSQSPQKPEIICIPGNPGISKHAKCVPGDISDIGSLAEFALEEKIDLTVVGPELPLSLGIVDEFERRGLKIFGPNKKAARLESSKIFAKIFMCKNEIPTSSFRTFSNINSAKKYIENKSGKYVIKADGLAAGKGVYICNDKSDGIYALNEIMVEKRFGEAGDNILIEDFIEGFEASCMMFFDGQTAKIMPIAKDYKKLNSDEGALNTGGMGSYCPHDLITPELFEKIEKNIINLTIKGLKESKIDYRGVLYIGLMIKDDEPYVLEYNVRLGDPEAQVILMLLKSDLVRVMDNCTNRMLGWTDIEWSDESAICQVAVSSGYPGECVKGFEISGIEDSEAKIFHAGTKYVDGEIITNGGRVYSVVAKASNLKLASELTNRAIEKTHFEGMYYRKDIGAN